LSLTQRLGKMGCFEIGSNAKRLQKKAVANLSISFKTKPAFALYANGGGDSA
jgi:hypothetical protein